MSKQILVKRLGFQAMVKKYKTKNETKRMISLALFTQSGKKNNFGIREKF